MCGICGIFEYATTRTPRLDAVVPMTAAIAHRGPDGDGTWCGPRIALGHRRLSIFDLSTAGANPMWSADRKAVVVYNGEIYNFKEIRQAHEREGRAFRTGTDTEVLLEHYRRHGIRALDDFRGMFGFALWDEELQRLFVVRDRLGVKPIYYVDQGGVLLFASELKSLLRHPEVSAELDREALGEWFALRFNNAPGTLFRGIRKLEAGHYLEVSGAGVRTVRYWDVPFDRGIRRREEAHEAYDALLRESVRLRMRADVPVGIFLSGGLDSSTVALHAAEAASGAIETFSVGYRTQAGLSELPRARAVAAALGAVHHELLLDEVSPDLLDDVVWHLEEPIGDPATVLLHRLAEFTRRRVTVVLSGEGSDETNLGYRKLLAFRRWARLQRLGPLAGPLQRWWLHRNLPALQANGRSPSLPEAYAELTWPGAGERASAVGDANGAWRHRLAATLPPTAPAGLLERMLYLDLKGWLGDDLLLKVDKTTMAHALEARVPFLDHKLVEFNLGLPPEWKIGSRGTKLFLREVVRGRLPADAVDGPQHGFLAPLGHWFGGPWRARIESALGPAGLGRRGLVAPPVLERIIAGVRQGRDADMLPAFMLASLEAWLVRFRIETS